MNVFYVHTVWALQSIYASSLVLFRAVIKIANCQTQEIACCVSVI